MDFSALEQRIRHAAKAAGLHLLASVCVALLAAALVFGLWFPYPYSELIGGRELFLIVVGVDVVCGPLLTLVVFDLRKNRRELIRDVALVALIQLTALGYGLMSVKDARPVFLAFEGHLFRVVSVPDIDADTISKAPPEYRELGLRGPRLLGTKLIRSGHPDFPESIKLAAQGMHPSFRPERWTSFDSQRVEVAREARSLKVLRKKQPDGGVLIDRAVQKIGMDEEKLGYLPFMAGRHTDWVVIVTLGDGQPHGFLPLDGW